MKKSIWIILLIFINLSICAKNVQEKRIYVVDLSGSMAGYKSETNVFNHEIEHLSHSINSLDDNIQVVVIPFAVNPLTPIQGRNCQIANQVTTLKVLQGNSNIYKAWTAALKEMDKGKVNKIFLITDGVHNTGEKISDLINQLELFPQISTKYNAKAYYLLLDSKFKNTQVAKVFDYGENMYIINNLNINPEIQSLQKSYKHYPIKTTTEISHKKRNIPLILSIILVLFILQILCQNIDRIITSFGKQSGGPTILPNVGRFTGKRGNSPYFFPEKPNLRGTNKEGLNGDELLKDPMSGYYGKDLKNEIPINIQREITKMLKKKGKGKGIPYKNGRPNFFKWSLPIIYMKITDNRNDNENRAIVKLAKRWKCSLKEAQEYKAKLDLIFHEVNYKILGVNIGCILTIPRNIHDNVSHTGGVSDAKNNMK